MRQWRLLVDEPRKGAENMAVDATLLRQVASGQSRPTLRLYAWEPLCLSLGYGQSVQDADADRLQQHGWHLVRRPTGGKSILHGDELTYSVTLPRDHELAQGDVVESYRRISQALLRALQILGLAPQSERQAKGNQGVGPVCFEVPSHYEITVQGKKLIGSAQVRQRDGILQHGSLPLHGDIARICEALRYPDEATREAARHKVRQRATTLSAALNRLVSWDEAAQALMQGFATTFDLYFEEQALRPEEQPLVREHLRTTYQNPEWTNKR